MAKKEKCECPKQGLTAPFYMLTYGDMMTLLLCFFILLFAMSTMEVTKFQAQVAIMQGSLGIAEDQPYAPMQQNLPAPAVKESQKMISQASITYEQVQSNEDSTSVDSVNPNQEQEQNKLCAIQTLGMQADLQVEQLSEELVLNLPMYGIFDKGEYKINPDSPQVQRYKSIYTELAKQIALLSSYDAFFVGHTDTLPLTTKTDKEDAPKNNMELGFLRAVAMYEFFFSSQFQDKTRITFSSQGDNVPVIPDATLDSEHRKNRRVQIHLKKRQKPYVGYTLNE